MFLHTAIALYHTAATNCQQGHSADLPQCKRSEIGLQTDVFTQNIQGFIYVGKGGQVKVVLALGSAGTRKILLQGPVRPHNGFLARNFCVADRRM